MIINLRMANTTMMTVLTDQELSNGVRIPSLGFGTWGLANGKEVQSVVWALEAGYRHIDTAKVYGSEGAVGQAVRSSAIPREEMFITTKLWNSDQGYEPTSRAIDASLEALSMEYVDLYLVHWPFTDEMVGDNKREKTWRAMEEVLASGKAKAIGVSNYLVEHLEEMRGYATVLPMVNQVECHPFWFRGELIDYCHEKGIVVTNYSPLTRGTMLDHALIQTIADEHEKTPAQILLRWGLQHGSVVIPKSSNKEHIEENLHIFDFTLPEIDMRALDGLNENKSFV